MVGRIFGRSRGQSLVEYALIIALVTLVVVATLILLGPQLRSEFQNIGTISSPDAGKAMTAPSGLRIAR